MFLVKQAHNLQIDAEKTTAEGSFAAEANTIFAPLRSDFRFLERSLPLTGETLYFSGKGPEAIGVEAAVAGYC